MNRLYVDNGHGGSMNDKGWTDRWVIGPLIKDECRLSRELTKEGWTDNTYMDQGYMVFV